ncbi:hypothetical protein BGX21_003726 [Mortierella sp. AD011]|nr:hypothetical protein BGX21_003726 [Mortierella sp. AD011]
MNTGPAVAGLSEEQPPSPYYSSVPTPYPVVYSTPSLIDSARSYSLPIINTAIPPPPQYPDSTSYSHFLRSKSLPINAFEMSSHHTQHTSSAQPEPEPEPTPTQSQVYTLAEDVEEENDNNNNNNNNNSSSRPRSVVDLAIETASVHPAGRTVRINVMTRWQSIPRNARIFLILKAFITIAKVVSTIVVLILDRDVSCPFLKVLIILYAVRAAIGFPFTVYAYLHPRVQGAPLTSRDILLERQRTLMDITGTSLFFLANYFLFTQASCRDTAPAVYFLTVVYVILGYIVILIPVVLCLAVILCLPLVLRIMRALDLGPVVGVKGATEEMIAAIPIVKYKKPAAPEAGEGEVEDNCTVVDMEENSSRDHVETDPNTASTATRSSTAVTATVLASSTIDSSHTTPLSDSNGQKRRLFGFFRKGKKLPNEIETIDAPSTTPPTTVEYLTLMDPQDAVCAICLCDYEDDEELRKMSCRHYFHKDCVDEWLRLNRNCPLCKRDIEELASETSAAATEATGSSSPSPPTVDATTLSRSQS